MTRGCSPAGLLDVRCRVDLPPTVPTSESDAAHPGATYGRFVPLGVLGRGGMGVVLRARDPELDREVAIKVLTSMSADAAVRLQREAQAMAKLSHPNVVTVYEIGQLGEGRFLAMELVEGTTLRQWLETARPWREILTAFIACGRGLAAAHAAGLVHRDFKPENVLIGSDGRPRVTDFGLAGIEASIAGTPAYMAPEQWLGKEADARADVFAFCVALWEALYKARPFGEADDVPPTRTANHATNDALRERVLSGEIREPGDHGVDGRIEVVLRRGLARDRTERWPSMPALLAELDRTPKRRWPWLAGGVLAAGALVGGIAMASSSEAEIDPCPDPEGQLAGLWDASVATKLRTAFASAAPAMADQASKRVIAWLDAYSMEWRQAGIAACKATHVEGTQPPELLERRVDCLDDRRHALSFVTATLLAADRDLVANAVERIGVLEPIGACADREYLQTHLPPADPVKRKQILDLMYEIGDSYTSEGQVPANTRQRNADKLVERARALGHPPMLLRALSEAQDAASDNSDQAASERYLRELAQIAAELHEDGRAARAWIDLVRLLVESRRLDEAKVLEPVVEAAVARAGSPSKLRYVQLATLGIRKLYEQDYPGSIASLEAAVKAADTFDQRAPVQLMLSQVIYMKDGPAAALPLAEASLAFAEQAYGKNHPQTAKAKHLIAQYLTEGRDLAKAAKIENEVVAIREAIYGPSHREVAIALHVVGNIEKGRRNYPEARKAYERAIAILDADRGTYDAGLSRGALATVIADTDGMAAAQPIFKRALDDLATGGKDKVQYLATEVDYAYHLLDAKQCAAAMPLLDHAIEILPKLRMRQLPQVLEASASCEVEAKRYDVALTKLERAHALCAEVQCPAGVIPLVDFKLGRLLIERGPDRARGSKLVAGAKAAATAEDDKELLSDIEHWEKLRLR